METIMSYTIVFVVLFAVLILSLLYAHTSVGTHEDNNGEQRTRSREQTDKLVPDGGRREGGKAAPPAEILAAPANSLATEPHPRDVTRGINTLVDAIDTVVDSLEDPASQGIPDSASPTDRAQALLSAVDRGEIIVSTDESQATRTADSSQTETTEETKIKEAAQEARQQTSLESATASRLVRDLESADGLRVTQLATTLTEALTELDQHHRISETLSEISIGANPRNLGTELASQFGDFEGEHARTMIEVGRLLEETTVSLDTCKSERDRLGTLANEICGLATEQTGRSFTPNTDPPDDVLNDLVDAINSDRVRFVDDSTSISQVVAEIETRGTAESKPAQELLHVLRSAHKTENRRIAEEIETAVNAIDRTETVTTRLDGFDPEALSRTADRLLAELSSESSAVSSQLRERIEEIKQQADRSNSADQLTLYAARQELKYYDRTLVPHLSRSEPVNTTVGDEIEDRIEEIEDRRSRMRQSYPSEYPDCDHTIPIYFFDLVSEHLNAAREHQRRGERKKAAGLVSAAETGLDWIEGLYETHSYFVLLKQLRG